MNDFLIQNSAIAFASSRPRSRSSRLLICKILLLAGITSAVTFFVGCSSSGSGSFKAAPRFASAEEDSYATTIENMEEGEEMRLPLTQQSYRVEGADRSPSRGQQTAVFTLRMEEGGESVTINTRGGPFTWEPGSVDVGGGHLIASDITGGVAITTRDLYSRYYDYVHFGYWQITSRDEDFEHELTQGAVFRQGFQTAPSDMPTTGSATFVGGMIGKVFNAGAPGVDLDGTFTLHADFTDRQVHGLIENDGIFNDIHLNLGRIESAAFSGAAVTAEPVGGVSFSEGVEGRYEGGFYGPSAGEVGGTWQLQEGDNIAVGAFGGPEQ